MSDVQSDSVSDCTSFPLGLAIDIGTTTVAMELIRLDSGESIASDTFLNSQRRFGADVLSRIRSAGNGHAEELRAVIHADIAAGIDRLTNKAGVLPSSIQKAVVAANTTMVHLFLGLPTDTLGTAPFVPAATIFPNYDFSSQGTSALENTTRNPYGNMTIPFHLVPSVSAFIGGDTVAGLAFLDSTCFRKKNAASSKPEMITNRVGRTEAPILFIDLGTNAEMVLIANGTYWCTSAAAGPAFEGGKISCGIGCVPGAVASVFSEGNRFGYSMIGDVNAEQIRQPIGLCGSGLMDFVACALDAGLIREDGSLSPVCEGSGILLDSAGRIRLLQRDIREVQLAKAAIRAGVHILAAVAGISESSIQRVFLAGSFGLAMNEKSALTIGLLPKTLAGRTVSIGNTSLAGAARFLLDPEVSDRFESIIQHAKTVSLADHSDFNRLFVDYMNF